MAPAAMSCRRRPVRWRASVAAVFLSFLHDEKGPKNLGRHQGPTALGNRPSPMSARPTRPTQSVFGIPILSERSSRVMPTRIGAVAGIYGCGILVSARLNMKTRHCISGCDRVVPSGLCPHCRFASSRGTKRSIYDRFM